MFRLAIKSTKHVAYLQYFCFSCALIEESFKTIFTAVECPNNAWICNVGPSEEDDWFEFQNTDPGLNSWVEN